MIWRNGQGSMKVVEPTQGMGLSLSSQAPRKWLRLYVWRLRLSGLTLRPTQRNPGEI